MGGKERNRERTRVKDFVLGEAAECLQQPASWLRGGKKAARGCPRALARRKISGGRGGGGHGEHDSWRWGILHQGRTEPGHQLPQTEMKLGSFDPQQGPGVRFLTWVTMTGERSFKFWMWESSESRREACESVGSS